MQDAVVGKGGRGGEGEIERVEKTGKYNLNW